MTEKIYLLSKRIFDFLVSLLAIPFFILPWVFISLIIKYQSPGPIIYKAKRVGKDGKTFTLYKFRTMRVDSGKIHTTTLRNDTRIFPFGHFLRKSKLDETPQIFNVLKGEMSLIGPRPEDIDNANKIYVGKYKKILSVKPGLSSPASLFDFTHGELYDNEEEYINIFLPIKLEMELLYIKNRGMVYDLLIIFRTLITIVLVILNKSMFNDPKELEIIKSENKMGDA